MGFGMTMKCTKCGYRRKFFIGSGFGYPCMYEQITDKIRKGAYGEKWKSFFAAHPGAVVNAEKELYRCPECNHLEEDYNLSLYDHKESIPPEDGYWAPWGDGKEGYRYIRSYPHICPECGKRMRKITEFSEQIPCPECDGMLEQDPCMIRWD